MTSRIAISQGFSNEERARLLRFHACIEQRHGMHALIIEGAIRAWILKTTDNRYCFDIVGADLKSPDYESKDQAIEALFKALLLVEKHF